MASEKGIELSDEEAGKYYAQLHKSGELSDDEIDNVAGGGVCDSGGNPQARAKCNTYVTLVIYDDFKPGALICKQCIAYDGTVCRHGKEKVYY